MQPPLRYESNCRILKHILKPYDNRGLKADLHGTILSLATSLRHAYDTKKSLCRILKRVLKPYNRGLNSVVSVS